MKKKLQVHRKILEQQIGYYRVRAPEYDEWFLRQGRYDIGTEWNKKWFAEVEELQQQLKKFHPEGDVLELAGGTGWWTEQLACYAESITAVDASPEVLEINRRRVKSQKVHYKKADIFTYLPDKKYDTVFFSFWLSHVPPSLFTDFWNLVSLAIKPQGRVFFIDSFQSERKLIAGKKRRKEDEWLDRRSVKAGDTFQIVKVFYEPRKLQKKLELLGWNISVKTTKHFFLYGSGSLST